MTRPYHRGLIVGKFSPLHRGHEHLVNRALEQCGELVVISYSNPEMEGCDAASRRRWFNSIFPHVRHLAVDVETRPEGWPPDLAWNGVPPNEADALIHRSFCALLCHRILGVTVDAVFTSEAYGDGFARELTRYFRSAGVARHRVDHVSIDPARRTVPASGTLVRQDIHAHRRWLSPAVYASFVKRVCLLGGESSGKSTLCERLAGEFDTRHAAEYGRERWEQQSGKLAFEDMQSIALSQVHREEAEALHSYRYLFCDTSPLTTLFYSRHLFGKASPGLEQLAERRYDHTFVCAPDFPFVQDGTRQPDAFRMRQHAWYLAELAERGVGFHLLTGSLEHRSSQVRALLEAGDS